MNRFFTWASFVIVIGLIVWGLIAADNKAMREEANLLPVDTLGELDHSRGYALAPVTLIEYGDFQCPACSVYHPIVEKLIATTATNTLRFAFRHFPLAQHANANAAAQAFEAAESKMWEMYDMLYVNQKEWESSKDPKSIFVGYAKSLGIDEKTFLEKFDLKDIKEKIQSDYKSGIKAGVTATPTFFVNGKKIQNPQNYDEFKKIIDDAIPKITL